MRRPLRTNPPDYFFIVLVVVLVVFGLVMLASASSDLAKQQFGDSYYYLLHQIYYGLSLGVLGFIAGMLIPSGSSRSSPCRSLSSESSSSSWSSRRSD